MWGGPGRRFLTAILDGCSSRPSRRKSAVNRHICFGEASNSGPSATPSHHGIALFVQETAREGRRKVVTTAERHPNQHSCSQRHNRPHRQHYRVNININKQQKQCPNGGRFEATSPTITNPLGATSELTYTEERGSGTHTQKKKLSLGAHGVPSEGSPP